MALKYIHLAGTFCDNLAHNLGGSCTENGGSFTLSASGGLNYRNGGMDNDGGGYYNQNICLIALYGENADSYIDKGTFSGVSISLGGTVQRGHIHGISGAQLTTTLDALGLYLGGCCYSSWSSMTCTWTDYPTYEGNE